MNEDTWPEGHAEFVAYCDLHPEATRDLTPFGWYVAGLQDGRAQADAMLADAVQKVTQRLAELREQL